MAETDKPLYSHYSQENLNAKKRRQKAQKIATKAEQDAASYLLNKGYKLLAKNWRAGKQGEIDLIVQDQNGLIVFVEVKARSSIKPSYGIPEIGFEAVNFQKRRKIMNTAFVFLQNYWQNSDANIKTRAWRYDVIVLNIFSDKAESNIITHVENAFT